jgi:hypothetical protein
VPLKDQEKRREYHREYMRRRLEKDPVFKAKHLARVKKNARKTTVHIKILLSDFRSKGCKKCGETCHACLDAHHIDPSTKDFTIGAVSNGQKIGKGKIEKELEKCVCLCKNCHAKLHAGLIEL